MEDLETRFLELLENGETSLDTYTDILKRAAENKRGWGQILNIESNGVLWNMIFVPFWFWSAKTQGIIMQKNFGQCYDKDPKVLYFCHS